MSSTKALLNVTAGKDSLFSQVLMNEHQNQFDFVFYCRSSKYSSKLPGSDGKVQLPI